MLLLEIAAQILKNKWLGWDNLIVNLELSIPDFPSTRSGQARL
jgi:hypothetical protein